MKVLITGCSGLIGSYLTHILTSAGHKVFGVDISRNYLNFSDLMVPNDLRSKYEEYRSQLLKDAEKILTVDIRNEFETASLISSVKPDVIVHLAALPLANVSFVQPQETFTMFNSTFSIIEAIRLFSPKTKLVYASSSMVYGNFSSPIVDENESTDPISAYGAAKLSSEILVKGYNRSYGVESIIVRPSAVYGPADINQRVVQRFLSQAIDGEALSVNDGSLVLDFTYVEDIANGFSKAVSYLNASRDIHDVFNITSSDPKSLLEVVNEMQSYFSDIEVELKDREAGVPTRGGLDITHAKKVLGYAPKYNFSEGLRKYISIEKGFRK